MTVSYFEGLESQMPAIEAERMQNAALAALYPHTTEDGARRLWSGWSEQINRVVREAGAQAGALFLVDGQPVGVAGFRKWIKRALGKGLKAA